MGGEKHYLYVDKNKKYVILGTDIERTANKVGGYSYQSSSEHPNGTWNNEVGYGLVNAYAAVKEAQKTLK
jgi:hypothetical protein